MSAASPAQSLKRTPLYEQHVSAGAKMVDFAGWEMPVFYRSILEEHKAVRRGAGMFDVSHMGQIFVTGKDSGRYLNHLLTNEIQSATPGTAIYAHMTNEKGGVIDDVIVYRLSADRDLIVANASRIEADLAWMRTHTKGFEVAIDDQSPHFGVIALQGPSAVKIAQAVSSRIHELHRFNLCQLSWKSHEIIVARTGYTGEDGFEFIAPNQALAPLWEALSEAAHKTNTSPFALCGLGARDTLRLEAGYPLWGHELSESITPLEINHGWVIKWQKDFIGKKTLEEQKQNGLRKKLMGFEGLAAGPIPRADSGIWTPSGEKAGTVTSGSFSPTLGKPVAVGFVEKNFWSVKEFQIETGGRRLAAAARSLPFYKPEEKKT